MSDIYHNWERLVRAVLKREEFRELAYASSRESSFSSVSADFSYGFSFSSPVPEASSSSKIAFYSRDNTGKNLPTPTSEDGIVQLPDWRRPISSDQLRKASRNCQPYFTSGCGYVYKGWIEPHTLSAAEPGYGMAVTIWRFRRTSFQGWSMEVNYNPGLRHPNLIKIISYYESSWDLLMVSEFVKGFLYNHLFGNGHSLSWATRIKVANGVAQGLSFLHDAKVLHGNLRSSNILIDEEFNAKLSEFGYARKLPATGDWTEQCDVYAFGVVLLELLTGCRATDIEQNLAVWEKSFLSDKNIVYRIMDPKLKGRYPPKGPEIVASIAFHCTRYVPEEGPRIKDVLIALTEHEI